MGNTKLFSIILITLLGLSGVLSILFYAGLISEGVLISWCYILMGIATLVAIVFPIITMIQNPKNAKIFCYFKSFNLSPQRIEVHIATFDKYKNNIPVIMDLVHYFLIVQGNKKNPQIRPIAIAEKYARGTLKLFNLNKLMKNIGIIPTMNQERFAW